MYRCLCFLPVRLSPGLLPPFRRPSPPRAESGQSTHGRLPSAPRLPGPSRTQLPLPGDTGQLPPLLVPGFLSVMLFLESSVLLLSLDAFVIVVAKAVHIWNLLPSVFESMTTNQCEIQPGSTHFYELVLFNACHWMLSCLFFLNALLLVFMIYDYCQCSLSLFWWW